MGRREVHLGVRRRIDGRADKLRDADGFSTCAGLRDAVPDDHDRGVSRGQDGGGVFDGSRVRGSPEVAVGRWVYVHLALVVQGVGGEGHEGRAGRGGLGLVEGAAQEGRDLFGVGRLGGEFSEQADHLGQVCPPPGELTYVQVAGAENQGGAALLGVVQQADPVGKPCLDVEVDEGGLPRRAGVAVRHSHGYAFLERELVVQFRVCLELVHDGRLARPWIPEDVPDALGLQRLHQRSLACHPCHVHPLLV